MGYCRIGCLLGLDVEVRNVFWEGWGLEVEEV